MAYRRIPSLNWLRVFEAAARTESFSDAAHILNMSPSAVSQQIGALEHHLGEKLFERRSRRVRLSDAGALFLPSVHESLSNIEASAAELFGLDATEQLTVHANTVFAQSWLAPRLTRFHDAHPNVDLNIVCIDSMDPNVSRRADVVISFGASAWEEGDTARLFPDRIFPVAPPAVAKAVTSPADLFGHRLIDVTGHRLTWRLVLGRLGLDPDEVGAMTFASTTSLSLTLAHCEGGIALARAPATDWLVEAYGLQPCFPGFEVADEFRYVLATRPANRRHRIASAFRDWVIAEAAPYL